MPSIMSLNISRPRSERLKRTMARAIDLSRYERPQRRLHGP